MIKIQKGNLDKLPIPPRSLSVYGKKKWREIGKELVSAKVLDRLDLHTLEMLCLAYERYDDCRKVIKKNGLLTQGQNQEYPSPAWTIECAAINHIEKGLDALCITRKTRANHSPPTTSDKQKVAGRKR